MQIIDSHIHTSETSRCGKIPARETVNNYKRLGYDAIIITDHMSSTTIKVAGLTESSPKEDIAEVFLRGYREAVDEGNKIGLKVFLGMEVRVNDHSNDYLLYGFDEEFVYKNEFVTKTIPEISKLAKENDLLFIQAHPYRSVITRDYLDFVDGIEVFNGHSGQNSRNNKAYELGLKIATERNDFVFTSGSDCHKYEDNGKNCVATSGMVFMNPVNNIRDFVNEVRAKNYRLMFDPNIV